MADNANLSRAQAQKHPQPFSNFTDASSSRPLQSRNPFRNALKSVLPTSPQNKRSSKLFDLHPDEVLISQLNPPIPTQPSDAASLSQSHRFYVDDDLGDEQSKKVQTPGVGAKHTNNQNEQTVSAIQHRKKEQSHDLAYAADNEGQRSADISLDQSMLLHPVGQNRGTHKDSYDVQHSAHKDPDGRTLQSIETRETPRTQDGVIPPSRAHQTEFQPNVSAQASRFRHKSQQSPQLPDSLRAGPPKSVQALAQVFNHTDVGDVQTLRSPDRDRDRKHEEQEPQLPPIPGRWQEGATVKSSSRPKPPAPAKPVMKQSKKQVQSDNRQPSSKHRDALGRDNATIPTPWQVETGEERGDSSSQRGVVPPSPAVEDWSDTPDQPFNFRNMALDISGDVKLAPVVEQYLQKAAQEILSQHPMFTSTSIEHLRISANKADHTNKQKSEGSRDDKDKDDTDDENFCCGEAESASNSSSQNVFYCYACKLTFCSPHWDQERAHRKKKPGHDKINAAMARMIEDTLDRHIDEGEQIRLHLEDESASWFGAIHQEDGVVFRDFGRYAALMSEFSLEHKKRAYPALISFVGDTGAGKSSLIKLLVGTKSAKSLKHNSFVPQVQQTPVVGNNGATTPTSGDVHLYADPETFQSERPILYADCEGLRGGTLEPIAARWRRKMHSHTRNRTRTASFDRHVRRRYESAEREVLWADKPEKKTRKYFVEHLYPRLLYTFSDVIVFVVQNARMIEDVMEQLIVWADAVLESANNQPVLPHAIIVLNASDNQDSRLWNVDNSTTALLNALSQAVEVNPRLKSFATKWNGRGFSISSVQTLLWAYYSSVRVIRIPEKKHPSLIHDQIKQLYDEINDAVTQAHEEKHQKRLKLNAESLQPYLQQAFDHFCHNLNDPFDFIKASFADTGIPSDFCGNTLKLTVDIMQLWSDKIDDNLLFKELSFLVASCVMLDAVRNQKLGEASGLFKEYIDHFDETVDDFYEKVWPCEFIHDKGRCTNVRAGHAKGHQLGKGQVVAGEYQSTSSADSLRELYRDYVFNNLDELLSRLKSATNEQEEAVRIHQTDILGPFYAHFGGAHQYVSHSTCLSCLVAPAEHCLPCGHVLCTPCIRDFGLRRSPNLVEIRYCPLHKSSENDWKRLIALKPDKAGTRILSLDGGGVRGILLLVTLERLQKDLGEIPMENFFDLIVGTSTGGIVALGLVEMGWSVAECLKRFWDLADKAFQKHKFLGIEWGGLLVSGYQGGLYKTEPLEEVLYTHYQNYPLFGGVRHNHPGNNTPCKVAVTSTSTGGTPFVFANYNRLEKDDNARYTFLRAEKPTKEIRIWQAARCTSAAPKLFKPYVHAESGQTFVDGGIYYNNPIEIALLESALIWPLDEPRLPDVLLSLGTGVSEKKRGLPSAPIQSSRTPLGQVAQHYKQLLKIATDHVKSSLRSEDEYRRVRELSRDSQQARNCFKRFNYHFPAKYKLDTDSVDKMSYLQEFAKSDLNQRKREIREIANRLIATSFYFEVEQGSIEKDLGGTITLHGFIRCRFAQTSSEMRMFGDLLRSRVQEAERAGGSTRHSPCFVILDKSRPINTEQLLLDDYMMSNMQEYGQFSPDRVTITMSNYNAESDIYLRFGAEPDGAEHNSISGFPRRWDDRRLAQKMTRLNLSDARTRQASRRGRPAWSGAPIRPSRMLQQYIQARNPGMAADDELIAVRSRLTTPNVLVTSDVTLADLTSSIDFPAADVKSLSMGTVTKISLSPPSAVLPATPDGRYGNAVEIMSEEIEGHYAPRQIRGLYELG